MSPQELVDAFWRCFPSVMHHVANGDWRFQFVEYHGQQFRVSRDESGTIAIAFVRHLQEPTR